MDADDIVKKLAQKYEIDAYRAMFNGPVHFMPEKYGVVNSMTAALKDFAPPYRVRLVGWSAPIYSPEYLRDFEVPTTEPLKGYVVLGANDQNVDGVKMSRLKKEDIFDTEQKAWDDVVRKLQCHKERNGGGPAYISLPPVRDKEAESRLQNELLASREAVLENANVIRDLCEKNLADENEGLSEEQLKKLTTFLGKWIEKLEIETPENEESEEDEDE